MAVFFGIFQYYSENMSFLRVITRIIPLNAPYESYCNLITASEIDSPHSVEVSYYRDPSTGKSYMLETTFCKESVVPPGTDIFHAINSTCEALPGLICVEKEDKLNLTHSTNPCGENEPGPFIQINSFVSGRDSDGIVCTIPIHLSEGNLQRISRSDCISELFANVDSMNKATEIGTERLHFSDTINDQFQSDINKNSCSDVTTTTSKWPSSADCGYVLNVGDCHVVGETQNENVQKSDACEQVPNESCGADSVLSGIPSVVNCFSMTNDEFLKAAPNEHKVDISGECNLSVTENSDTVPFMDNSDVVENNDTFAQICSEIVTAVVDEHDISRNNESASLHNFDLMSPSISCNDLDSNDVANSTAVTHEDNQKNENSSNQVQNTNGMFSCTVSSLQPVCKFFLGDKCLICGDKQISYSNFVSRKKHLDEHLSSTEFICDVCKKHFYTSSCLSNHKVCHMEKCLYYCVKCPRKFKRKNKLSIHMASEHNMKFITCPFCAMKHIVAEWFAVHSKQQATDNITDHNYPELFLTKSENSYQCTVCGAKFCSAFKLKLHSREHNPKTCSMCHTLFKTQSLLTQHIDSHHKCDFCKRMFYLRKDRLQHMAVHSDVRNSNNSCKLCDAKFKFSHQLKSHIKWNHNKRE